MKYFDTFQFHFSDFLLLSNLKNLKIRIEDRKMSQRMGFYMAHEVEVTDIGVAVHGVAPKLATP